MINKTFFEISAFVFLMLPIIVFSQINNENSKRIIPYKFSEKADSLLVLKLDSICENQIKEHLIIDVIYTHESFKDYYLRNRYEAYISIRILCVLNYRANEKKCYLSYLARNTSRYYVSNNRKYSIPVIFSQTDERFQFDNYSLEGIWVHPRRIFLVILDGNNDVTIDYNMPIFETFLKK